MRIAANSLRALERRLRAPGGLRASAHAALPSPIGRPQLVALVSALSLVASLAASGAGAAPARSSVRLSGLTVFAGSSMTTVLPQIDPGNTYSFGSSSTLATQISNGAPADVLMSANTTIPAAVVFAIALVAGPFYIRQGIASFEAVDSKLLARRGRSARAPQRRSSGSRFRSPAAGWQPARRSASRAVWVSSGRPSCSQAAFRGGRRRSRSRSTGSSRRRAG